MHSPRPAHPTAPADPAAEHHSAADVAPAVPLEPVLTAGELLAHLAVAGQHRPVRLVDGTVACGVVIDPATGDPILDTRTAAPVDAAPGAAHLDTTHLRILVLRWITGWTGSSTSYRHLRSVEATVAELARRTRHRHRAHSWVHAGLRRITAGRDNDLDLAVRNAAQSWAG